MIVCCALPNARGDQRSEDNVFTAPRRSVPLASGVNQPPVGMSTTPGMILFVMRQGISMVPRFVVHAHDVAILDAACLGI